MWPQVKRKMKATDALLALGHMALKSSRVPPIIER